jgi:hypothetical protein
MVEVVETIFAEGSNRFIPIQTQFDQRGNCIFLELEFESVSLPEAVGKGLHFGA